MSNGRKRHGQPPGVPGGGSRLGLALPPEKAKNSKQTLFRLIRYMNSYKISLAAVFLAAIGGTLFGVISPKILGEVTTLLFDSVVGKLQGAAIPVDFAQIGRILFLLMILYILSAFFSYLEGFIMARVSQKIVFDLRNELREKLSKLPLQYYDTNKHGEILSRVTNDMDTVGNTLQQTMTQAISAVVKISGIVVMMLTISPLLTLITFVTLPLNYYITGKIAKRSQKIFADQQKELGALSAHIEEMYGGHVIIKSFGQEKNAIEKFREINARYTRTGWRSQFMAGLIMPLLGLINNIGYILICVMGAIFVAQGRITIGNVQAFLQYSKQFTQPILQTATIANMIQAALAAAERVFELLDEAEEVEEKQAAIANFEPLGQVRFESVRFSYHQDRPLIRDLTIEVQSGQVAAIVGPTGAGKTTLVNLLLRFYEIEGGRILIDGVDIRDIRRTALRSLFGMVLQDTWLFQGSVKDNIAFGREGAREEEIRRAAELAYADHFIRSLPQGYETILNEDSTNLSEGQKQLLTIARAILADPAILILDEATSSIDTRTEQLLQKAMRSLTKGRTSFIIAHRLSTIRNADIILVMDQGKVIEQGTHDELLRKKGFYAKLYQSQFSDSQTVAVESRPEVYWN